MDGSMTMIEQMARAMAEGLGDDFDDALRGKREWVQRRGAGLKSGRYRDVNEPYQADYIEAATAALTALETPTPEMVKAGAEHLPGWDPEDDDAVSIFTAMIRAAQEQQP